MKLDAAIETATRLRDALSAEVESARTERGLLRKLDGDGLFARAAERARFLGETSRLERDLAAALARAAGALGLPEVTLARLELAAPGPARRLASLLGEIRALAGALREIDGLNAALAQRALSCVRGYVDALAPRASAYDRAGARAAAPQGALVSIRG